MYIKRTTPKSQTTPTQQQVTLGCRMLHYTGHGSPSCLIFENENGEANLLVRYTYIHTYIYMRVYIPGLRTTKTK